MKRAQGLEMGVFFQGDAVSIWAERVARMDVLRDLVPSDHPVLEAENILLSAAEDSLVEQVGDVLRKHEFKDAATRQLLARVAGYLRSYGVSAAAIPARVGKIRELDLPRVFPHQAEPVRDILSRMVEEPLN